MGRTAKMIETIMAAETPENARKMVLVRSIATDDEDVELILEAIGHLDMDEFPHSIKKMRR